MQLRTFALSTIACVLLVVSVARADILDTPIPKPVFTKMYGSLQVQRYGSGSPALILVPGLSFGAWSFHDTIARESKSHAVYAVTLAGFDGVAGGKDDSLDAVDASLGMLIATEKLERPVLIGHSLGGTIVLRYGVEHASSLAGVVSVDGTPVFPSLANATPDIRRDAAKQYYTAVMKAVPATYDTQQTETVDSYITDQTLAARVANLSLRSDRHAVASYGRDLYASDLRPQLPQLTVPTILIVPVPAPPIPAYYPAQMATMSDADRRLNTVGFYQTLVVGAPQLTIMPVDNSRSFVMFDQPAIFAQLLDTFLATLH
jgi:pimeloyl-ACP methyl ester carboxylesterase